MLEKEIIRKDVIGVSTPVEKDRLRDHADDWILGLRNLLGEQNEEISKLNVLKSDPRRKVPVQELEQRRATLIAEKIQTEQRLREAKGLITKGKRILFEAAKKEQSAAFPNREIVIERVLSDILHELRTIRRQMEFNSKTSNDLSNKDRSN